MFWLSVCEPLTMDCEALSTRWKGEIIIDGIARAKNKSPDRLESPRHSAQPRRRLGPLDLTSTPSR